MTSCANEAAYPLLTWVLLFDALVAGFVICVRVPVSLSGLISESAVAATFWPLYAIPAHALGHVVVGGLLYYCYPYALVLAGFGVITWIMALADADALSLFQFLKR